MQSVMRAELEAIVAADEEAWSRVSSADERAGRAVAAAREEVERQIADRKQNSEEVLDRELAAIRAEGEAAVGELRARGTAYGQTVAAAAAARLEEAARLYTRVVVDGPPEAKR
jgi:vacuolar-type H+-ATPase subunit H